MKKLFLLCAFLFMSMEMQAQLYIVHTYLEPQFNEQTGLADGMYLAYMTTCSPDGATSTVSLPLSTDLQYQYIYGNPEQMEEHLQIINEELNNIISQGYKLIHATTEATTGALAFHTYYLAVP